MAPSMHPPYLPAPDPRLPIYTGGKIMSNKYKRPAVVLTEEMKRAACNAPLPMVLLDSISARQDLEFESKFYAAIAAAPQPPALGDEVEIGIGSDEVIEELKMMADMADNNEDPDDHMMYMRWLSAIRSANAQVAPLQAEIEQLKSEIAAYKASRERLHGWIREEQLKSVHLKARCDDLEDLLRDINDASGGSQFKKHIDAALSKPAASEQA